MKSSLVIGIVLIALGAGILGYRQLTYTTTEEVLKIGPISATAEKEHTINFPAVLGWVLLAGGIGVIVFSRGRK
jgi:hypothetical protein